MRGFQATRGAAVAVVLGAPAGLAAEPIELECLLVAAVEVIVSAGTEGVVETMAVERGDRVKQGDVLGTLEASVERAALRYARVRAGAEADFRRNRVRLKFADRTLERTERLQGEGIVAVRDHEEAESEKALAEAGLLDAREARELALAEVNRAESVVELRTIRSPLDGIVVEKLLSPGDLADPPQLVKLVSIDPLHVEAFAPLSAWGKIEPGAEARVRPEEPVGGTYPATVKVVDPVIDAASGTFRIRLELPNPDHRLPAGLNCRVQLLDNTPPVSGAPTSNGGPEPVP
jgi:RND family efflux transporter MFP subunit